MEASRRSDKHGENGRMPPFCSAKRRKKKLQNGMEVPKNSAIQSEKPINFGKSSGGKQEESHLRKLDTFNEMRRKNYLTTYNGGKKSFSSFKTITESEFLRRRSFFENSSGKTDSRIERPLSKVSPIRKNWISDSRPVNLYLYGCFESRNEYETREKEMAHKLNEIHQMIERMQQMAEDLSDEKFSYKKTKQVPETFIFANIEKTPKSQKMSTVDCRDRTSVSLQGPTGESSFGAPHSAKFETSCKLKRKLIPSQFMSSFETELGSTGKSFTEQINFQTRFVFDMETNEN